MAEIERRCQDLDVFELTESADVDVGASRIVNDEMSNRFRALGTGRGDIATQPNKCSIGLTTQQVVIIEPRADAPQRPPMFRPATPGAVVLLSS